MSNSPIPGFRVLSLQYPNHIHPERVPFAAEGLAIRLSRDMDVEWFGHRPELTRFAVPNVAQATGDHTDAWWFDFGPYDGSADEFVSRYTVIVRETAGGGFMLLVQDGGASYAPTIAKFFKKIIDSNTLATS